MSKDKLNESLIYDELDLNPIWKTLPQKEEDKSNQLPTNSSIVYLKNIKLDGHNVSFIAPIFNLSTTKELELFEKISIWLDTFSDKSIQLQPLKMIQESGLMSEMESCQQLIFLEEGLNKTIEKEYLNIPYITSVSLKEMVENPEKKRKLWQDIKELTKSIKQ